MFKKSALELFKKELMFFSLGRITGHLLLKFSSGEIVYMEKTQRLLSRNDQPDERRILIYKCVKALEKFQDEKFYGEIVVVIYCGEIAEILVQRKYREQGVDELIMA